MTAKLHLLRLAALVRYPAFGLWGAFLVCACLGFPVRAAAGEPDRNQDDNLGAARELIARIVPERAKSFIVEKIAADQGRDVFEIESRGRKIILRGNNGVAVGAALNWYLKFTIRSSSISCSSNHGARSP